MCTSARFCSLSFPCEARACNLQCKAQVLILAICWGTLSLLPGARVTYPECERVLHFCERGKPLTQSSQRLRACTFNIAGSITVVVAPALIYGVSGSTALLSSRARPELDCCDSLDASELRNCSCPVRLLENFRPRGGLSWHR